MRLAAWRFTSSLSQAALAAGRYQPPEDRGQTGQDGKGLFFFSPAPQQIMAVDVSQKGASLQLGTPHAQFKTATVGGPGGPYAVSADGKKFVVNAVLPQSITEPLTLITNWLPDLKQ